MKKLYIVGPLFITFRLPGYMLHQIFLGENKLHFQLNTSDLNCDIKWLSDVSHSVLKFENISYKCASKTSSLTRCSLLTCIFWFPVFLAFQKCIICPVTKLTLKKSLAAGLKVAILAIEAQLGDGLHSPSAKVPILAIGGQFGDRLHYASIKSQWPGESENQC